MAIPRLSGIVKVPPDPALNEARRHVAVSEQPPFAFYRWTGAGVAGRRLTLRSTGRSTACVRHLVRLAAYLVFLLAWLSTSSAADYACSRNPAIVDRCFEIHGRLSFWNGAPSARIWRIGTSRMLGVHNDELPPELAAQLTGFDTEAWGNFTVCPFAKERAGRMQFVCIESWRDVTMRKRSNAS